jgi:hypothetical protein
VSRSFPAWLDFDNNPHDVAFLPDQVLVAIDLDLGTGPLAECHAVAGLDVSAVISPFCGFFLAVSLSCELHQSEHTYSDDRDKEGWNDDRRNEPRCIGCGLSRVLRWRLSATLVVPSGKSVAMRAVASRRYFTGHMQHVGMIAADNELSLSIFALAPRNSA